MKKFLFMTLVLFSCSKQTANNTSFNQKINFDKDYSLAEFKKILNTYNDLSGYPDIDK